ncbi:MAG: hypothetical protein A2283_12460 [Lentisphaerae bacterium RIFOXYA12_FULL_48_11]|nr:MAG: hypothetical protein A2283_12460 [Lentisphaerae bacterium RIFOXYA12_FULL_48_11]
MSNLKVTSKITREYGGRPFDEAIAFFRQKLNIPTEHWDDLWKEQHAKGFMVAGAMKAELLTDLRIAMDKAISSGTTLKDFRKDFDKIVEKHGWIYKGGRNWRTKVIYDTNVRTAYMAGRYQQMTDPDVTALRPYFLYRHGDSRNPRPHHLALDGLVLRYDDPFWKTHYPPNGWGCKCKVLSLSKRDLAKMGKTGPDKTPEIETRTYEDRNGNKSQVPVGIDPGFDYNVGKAAWGSRISQTAMDAWRKQGSGAWEKLSAGNYITLGRPEVIPADTPVAAVNHKADTSIPGMQKDIESVIGGSERIFSFSKGEMSWDVMVNASVLAEHIDPARAKYIPFLPETLFDPFEIWMAFEKHKGTGKVVLRQRIIKGIDMGRKQGMLVVTNSVNGVMEAWTMIPSERIKYLQNQRYGELVWKRN